MNRSVLKKQLEEELADAVLDEILEAGGSGISVNECIEIRTYQSIEQSLKSSNVQQVQNSIEMLRKFFYARVQIFMSATIENIIPFLKTRTPVFGNDIGIDDTLSRCWADPNKIRGMYEYHVDVEYDYIKLFAFDNVEELLDIIKENYQDTAESVLQVTKEKYIDKRIVIATAVIDNGISFHDDVLRNMVILADSKEEFIQMLGRKRKDGKDVNVYVCRRDREHFRKRLEGVKEILKIYNRYASQIRAIWGNMPGIENYPYNYLCTRDFYMPIIYYQNNMLEDMMKYKRIYQSIRKICYLLNGAFAINTFAIVRYGDLKRNYKVLMEELESDQNAFLRKQVEWLGKSIEDIQQIVKETEETREQRHIQILSEELKKIENKSLTSEENIEFKKKIQGSLIFFAEKYLQGEQKKNDLKNFKDSSITLTKDKFNNLMKCAKLPYELKKDGGSLFIFSEIEISK